MTAQPLLVTYATNYPGCCLQGAIANPEPFWRRVSYYTCLKVKEEFRLSNGALDKVKADAAGTHDMFEIEVSVFDPAKVPKEHPFASTPFRSLGTFSLPQFSKMLVESFRAHM